jgi:hypothetical protein
MDYNAYTAANAVAATDGVVAADDAVASLDDSLAAAAAGFGLTNLADGLAAAGNVATADATSKTAVGSFLGF